MNDGGGALSLAGASALIFVSGMNSGNRFEVVIKESWSVWRLLGALPLILVFPITGLSLWIIVSETLAPVDPSDDSSRSAGGILLMATVIAYGGWVLLMFLASRFTASKQKMPKQRQLDCYSKMSKSVIKRSTSPLDSRTPNDESMADPSRARFLL